MAKVELARNLSTLFPQLASQDLLVNAATVAEVVQSLEARAPGFAFYVCDERGRLRTHVNIFVGEDRVSDRQRLSDAVAGGGLERGELLFEHRGSQPAIAAAGLKTSADLVNSQLRWLM